MATQVTPAGQAAPPAGAVPMSEAHLRELMLTTAREAIGPAVAAALEPLTKAQGDVMARIAGALPKAAEESKVFDLGKYPIGRKIRALAMATLENKSQDPEAAIHAIKRATGAADRGLWPAAFAEPTIKWLEHVKATLLAGNAAVAGDMIMPAVDPEWIALLRSKAKVRGIARTYPMPRGATYRRKQTDAATATYQGESDRFTPSNLKVGRVPLSYKKLTAMSVVGNDLIRFTSGEADRIVQEDLLRVSALREDRAFLVGNPPADTGSPQGIRFQTKAANVFASAGVTLANIQADLTKALRLVEEGDVELDSENGYWFMSPATYWVIYALATTTGDWMFAQELKAGRLFGYQVIKTTQLSVSKSWIGANAGLIMFVYAPALEIHDSLATTVATYVGGAYYDPALAAVASGISNDETVITCISEHDFLQVYDVAAAVITGYAT